jgi:peptidoglycan/xylan/chitin deacetylase (PgdA/CDA1 family)
MPLPRTAGSDNPYAAWQPIVARAPLAWPNSAAVAAAIVVSIEHLEWAPPPHAIPPRTSSSYGPYPRAFQITGVSRPEYGSRVGVFRLLEVLDRHDVTPCVAMDAALLDDRPRLVEELQLRSSEFLGHGMALSRTLSEALPEHVEAAEIDESLERLERATASRPRGWLGADYAESTRTVRLLAERGLRYVCDWPNDEQPYRLSTPAGELVSLPVAVDLDDGMAQKVRRLTPRRWTRLVLESLERLRRDGAERGGRLLVLNLHAHVSGQPFRIRQVEEVVAALRADPAVWLTTTGAIVDWYEQRASA